MPIKPVNRRLIRLTNTQGRQGCGGRLDETQIVQIPQVVRCDGSRQLVNIIQCSRAGQCPKNTVGRAVTFKRSKDDNSSPVPIRLGHL